MSACAAPSGPPTPAPTSSSVASPDPNDLLHPDAGTSSPADVVIAAADGIYSIPEGGEPRRVYDGTAAVAVDDTRGGIVFQASRGIDFPQPSSGSTEIRWQRSGGSAELVVSPSEGQHLTLHDAVETTSGVRVLYTLSVGSTPDDSKDTLISLDPATGATREIRTVGAWEYASGPISVAPSVIGLTSYAEAFVEIEFFTHDAEAVDIPGNPLPEANHEYRFYAAELRPDTEILGYLERSTSVVGAGNVPSVVLVDTDSGQELERLRLLPGEDWQAVSLDIGNDVVIVNRTPIEPTDARYLEAWTIDLRGDVPVVWEAPIKGEARLLRSEITGGQCGAWATARSPG